jgi:hypothetical protein
MRRNAILGLFLSCLALLVPSMASAIRTDDLLIVIPVIGRVPGALGSQWRTDVFVANHSSVTKTATLRFYPAGSAPIVRTASLSPYSTASFPDIVLNTFGLTTGSGELEVESSNQSAIEARARIYNVGSGAGEFGQNVPGFGRSLLSRQAFVYGLSGIGGNRVNAGITNPNADPVTVSVRVSDRNNTMLASDTITVQPHQNFQFDVFTRFGIAPQADVQIDMNTAEPQIYGYASEVRNDSGDAVFIFGTSPNS